MDMRNFTAQTVLRLMLAAILLCSVPFGLAADDGDGNREHWTAVGSSGTADEDSRGQVGFYQGVAFMGGYGTATLRYNVTATDDLFGGNTTRFVMRYLDTGPCAKVEACLFRYNLNTGANDLLMTINSNSFPQSTSFQTRFIDSTTLPAFDFDNNAYYVEVYLTESCNNGVGNARIGILRLSRF
ncbi:MAG: hypothetical protein U0Y68_10655 [Blastocatellia bacterium]